MEKDAKDKVNKSKHGVLTEDNYKYWKDALFISVILDGQEKKESDEDNDK